jgi:hypothetical protein
MTSPNLSSAASASVSASASASTSASASASQSAGSGARTTYIKAPLWDHVTIENNEKSREKLDC